jgi:hypothetical protein
MKPLVRRLLAIAITITLVKSIAAGEPATLPSSSDGAVLLGTVSFANGTDPITDAIVALQPTDAHAQATKRGLVMSVNPAGAFAFADCIPVGKYIVRVIRTNSAALVDIEPLEIKGAGPRVVVLDLRAGKGSLSGTVVDSEGKPARGAYVSAVSQAPLAAYRVTADADGHYRVSQMVPGRYLVVVRGGPELAGPRAIGRDIIIESAPVTKDFTLIAPTSGPAK